MKILNKKLPIFLLYLLVFGILSWQIYDLTKTIKILKPIVRIDTIYQKIVYPSNSLNVTWKAVIEDSIDIYHRYKIEFVEEVEATIYHAVKGQTNDQPLITASRLKINHTDNAYSHRYLAVSQDFIKSGRLAYGDLVLLDGISIPEYNGIWIIADCMNYRFTNKVDLLVNPGMKGDYWKGNRKITMYKLSS